MKKTQRQAGKGRYRFLLAFAILFAAAALSGCRGKQPPETLFYDLTTDAPTAAPVTEPVTEAPEESSAEETLPPTGWRGRQYYRDEEPLRGMQEVGGERYYFTDSGYHTGWLQYEGYQLYFQEDGRLDTDLRDMFPDGPYRILVNKECSTVTVYTKDEAGSYCVPVCAFLCSCGRSTPINTYHLRENYRWHELYGHVYGQWCTRIHDNILFHSIYYYSEDCLDMDVEGFNALGTNVSAGCVRLKAGDAKWIYNHCDENTRVKIYNDSDPGPFGKPAGIRLLEWHTWDPSDPNAVYRCMERGCHREFWPEEQQED